MNIKLTQQKRLMQKAIDNLNHIEQLERMGDHLDPEYTTEQTMKCVDEYAEIMKQLVSSCLESAGMKLQVA